MADMASYKIGGISALLESEGKETNSGENKSCTLASLFGTPAKELKEETVITFSRKRPQSKSSSKAKRIAESQDAKRDIKSGEKKDDSIDESFEASPKPKKQKQGLTKDDSRLGRTVFVGNIPLSMDRKKLKKYFDKYGKVETVRIRSLPVGDLKLPRKACAAKKLYHKDRATMNSYVVFEDESSAAKALESNGVQLEGYHIRVDLAAGGKKHDHSKSIFVGNLPFVTEAEELRNHFCQCGDIADVRIIRDKVTGVGKGFGYVRFQSRDGVSLALKMDQSEFKGRNLRVSRSVDPAKKKGGKGERRDNQVKRTKSTNFLNKKKGAKTKHGPGQQKSNREAFTMRIDKKNNLKQRSFTKKGKFKQSKRK